MSWAKQSPFVSLKQATRAQRASSAFTIVELLIVVVVIAILAAITIVAYNGITNRAKQSAVNSAVSTASKKVQLYAIENSDTYPTTLTQVGIQGSDQPNTTTYRYTANNTTTPKTYCITAINGTTRAYLSNTSTSPQTGSCPGHDNDGNYVTNYIANPSFENNLDGWEAYGGATIERTTEQASKGRYSLKVTPASGATSGVRYQPITTVMGYSFRMSTKLRVSATLPTYMDGSDTNLALNVRMSWNGATVVWQSELSPNTWAGSPYMSTGSVSNTGGSRRLTFQYEGTRVATIVPFYIDEATIEGGSSTAFDYNTYDGDSPGWIWNGTPGNSTSTGPRN